MSARIALRPPVLLAVLATLTLSGCYQVPVTGRKALDLTSDVELAKVSSKAFDEIKSRHRRSTDRTRLDQVQRVGERIAKVVFWDMPNADWEFGIFSGLFRIADSDDELASVIAHEIAHVTARHVHERLSQEMLAQAGGVIGGVGLMGAGAGSLTTSALLGLYDSTATLQMLAYDRGKEKEADYIGLMYAARAGFNPEAAISVLEKLEAETGSQPRPPAFASTHPPTPDRIVQLRDAMPKALEVYRSAGNRPAPPVVR